MRTFDKFQFRGKSELTSEQLDSFGVKNNDGWVYGSYLDGYILQGLSKAPLSVRNFVPVFIESVGQYTGVKDIFQNKIYEGDYIYAEHFLYPCKDSGEFPIFWDEKKAGFQMDSFNMETIKITGNAFDRAVQLNKNLD